MVNAVLAITTYNRKENLEALISSFVDTHDRNLKWTVIIADDGSTDSTLDYLGTLELPQMSMILIHNNRRGVHYQFNTIVRQLESLHFDVCFKCDDDIQFTKPGWESLYITAMQESGYDHLCYFDPTWRPEKNLSTPVGRGRLISYCKGKDVQGAFFTITPEIVKKVGYMDVQNFGFRGVGHIDFTLRACRLGFNDIENPFDAAGSSEYLSMQHSEYRSALPSELIYGLEDDEATKRKYDLIEQLRTYVPFRESNERLDGETEREYLVRAVKSLETQKLWYEQEIQRLKLWEKEAYGHLPKWYLRLGRIFKAIRR